MKQITIRSIPDAVKKTVQKEAAQKGVSLNKAIISLLERAVGTKAPEKKKRALYNDLDHLAGLWSREEAAEFDKNLKAQRKVDAELWKKSK
jgi:plasmid stability protein